MQAAVMQTKQTSQKVLESSSFLILSDCPLMVPRMSDSSESFILNLA